MKKVAAQRQDVAFFIKMFPLQSIHPDSYTKSASVLCGKTNEERLQRLEDAFAKKPLPQSTCTNEALDKSLALAQRLGISGTPGVFFENGKHVGGFMPAEEIIKTIDSIN